MGSASSKTARKLPKQPSWAGARTPGPGPAMGEAQAAMNAEVTSRGPRTTQTQKDSPYASGTKDEAIMRDAQDPQLHANLSRLGPVKVDHHMQTIKLRGEQVSQAHNIRLQSEVDASSPHAPHNRMLAASFADLLEERKNISTRSELEEICRRYDIDVDKLESVARFINTPSIEEGSVRTFTDADGNERVTMLATWKEPVIVNDPSARIA